MAMYYTIRKRLERLIVSNAFQNIIDYTEPGEFYFMILDGVCYLVILYYRVILPSMV